MKFKKFNLAIISLFSLFACNSQSENDDNPLDENMNNISFNLYLERSKQNDSKNFWELELNANTIVFHFGDVGTNGQILEKEYVNETIARYEAFKELKSKRNEGFQLPNQLSFETLLSHEKTRIRDIDESLISSLEGDHYTHFILINDNVHLDKLDIDALHGIVDGLIINGNLIVDGGIYNASGDYGPALIVSGDVKADFLIGGGSEIYLKGKSYIHSFIIGHYNHGTLYAKDLITMVSIDDDHHMSIGWGDTKIEYDYDVYGSEEDKESLRKIYGEDQPFHEHDFFTSDEFNKILIEDNEGALNLLKELLDGTYAGDPQMLMVMADGLSIKDIENPSQNLQLAAITENPQAFKLINKPSEEVQLHFAELHPWHLNLIMNPSDNVIKRALNSAGSAIEHIDHPSDEFQRLAVTNEPYSIKYIKSPSEEAQLIAVQGYADAIETIENPSDQVKIAALNSDGSSLRYIKNPTDEMKLIAVKNSAWAINFIQSPSEELMIEAVSASSSAIEYIKNPSQKVMLMAVKDNGFNIEYIKNPTEEMQMLAVKSHANAIEYIENPSETLQMAAVQQRGHSLEHIKNPSEAVKLAAVKQHGAALSYIKEPSYEVQLAAIENFNSAIRYIENPSDELMLIVVKDSAHDIQYINKPSEEAQLISISQRPDYIKYINNPTEKVQLSAVRRKPNVIRFIKKPTQQVIDLEEELSKN